MSDEIIAFRSAHGLDLDPERSRVWLAQLGGMIIPLPNFRWRRAIIGQHDRHHLVTGYPATFEGELFVAAWEAGARCYPHPCARLLCWSLMLLGLMVQTRGTLAAFNAGRMAS
ncbi:MAG: hypothetical protein M3Q19_02340 [Pseudomonadota bacterium]|nr:hypothetical protein [Pseudomonadota bacterium]